MAGARSRRFQGGQTAAAQGSERFSADSILGSRAEGGQIFLAARPFGQPLRAARGIPIKSRSDSVAISGGRLGESRWAVAEGGEPANGGRRIGREAIAGSAGRRTGRSAR